MADPQHVSLIRKGAAEWNKWRTDNDSVQPDLREADLSGAHLIEADLSRAALIETNLEGAILTGAKVYEISVWDVKLENAVQTSLIITPDDQPRLR
jgi:uncharacterized protein YjbI with pentapeptide repeats